MNHTKFQKLRNLLNETPESFYWLGFLFADGHFSSTNRLQIGLSGKDSQHLEKLAAFLNLPVNSIKHKHGQYHKIYLSVMDVITVKYLKETYKIESNKTYTPIDLSSLTSEQLKWVTIGFIDGDGSIQFQQGRKDAQLSIKCHQSWLHNLEIMFGSSRLNNSGYAFTSITNSVKLKELKQIAVDYKLPVLDRKWDKIDMNKISRQEKASIWHPVAKKLYLEGKTIDEICVILDKKYTTVYQSLKRKDRI